MTPSMWALRFRSASSRDSGLPSSSRNIQAGVWLCQQRLCLTTFMSWRRAKSTILSAAAKLNWPGLGCRDWGLNSFSALRQSNCFATSAASPELSSCRDMTAVPMRNRPFTACRSVSAGSSAADRMGGRAGTAARAGRARVESRRGLGAGAWGTSVADSTRRKWEGRERRPPARSAATAVTRRPCRSTPPIRLSVSGRFAGRRGTGCSSTR